jgi:hypothetical protein
MAGGISYPQVDPSDGHQCDPRAWKSSRGKDAPQIDVIAESDQSPGNVRDQMFGVKAKPLKDIGSELLGQ